MTHDSPGSNGNKLTKQDIALARIDDNHCVYLCRNRLVHLVWGQDMLPFCPGDFVGLGFQLSGLKADCDMQCRRGEACDRLDVAGRTVHLECNSFQLPLTPDACYRMQSMVQEATRRLYDLRQSGFFSVQRWGPPRASGNGRQNISVDDMLQLEWQDRTLAHLDAEHRVYLCEHGVVHLVWGQVMLPFCPDDFAGLPPLLSGTEKEACGRQCLRGNRCGLIEGENGLDYLQYGSFRLSLDPPMCSRMQGMVQAAAEELFTLRQAGYFSMPE
jgi:hypothetical protein